MEDLFDQIHHINMSAEEPDRVQLYVCQKLVQALLSTKHEAPRQVYADILRFLSSHQNVKTAADAIDWFVHGEDAVCPVFKFFKKVV
jgi:CCR4-NOT transcription complex subunit 1